MTGVNACGLAQGYAPTPGTFTEARQVVQQFKAQSGEVDAMFTVEVSKDGEMVLLKSWDDQRMVATALSYETANALQVALSDALDTIEGTINLTSKNDCAYALD